MAGHHPPVTDWATDFDHTDAGWVQDPYPIWEDLRGRCPVAHSSRFGGVWLPTRHEDIAAIAYDTEHFSSQGVVVSEDKPVDPAPMGGAPPITSDPPFHHFARRLLLPPFSPKAVAALEPATRQVCRDLLAAMGDADVVDAARAYAQHIPSAVIARMLGLPVEDTELFGSFIHSVLESVDIPEEERRGELDAFEHYLDAAIADHQAHPRDDLIGYLLELEVEGVRLEPAHVRGTILLVLIAGIDTTWSAIGASLWHLARTPSDRARLAADPGLLPTATEELLRAFAPVTMARLVAKEVEIGGQTLSPGDWLLLPFPAANRDPAVFERADEVVLDRAENRHAAFGLGIHRCIGSNLARMELRVALEEWLAHVPDFELADPGAVRWSAGQVRGPRNLPVRILR